MIDVSRALHAVAGSALLWLQAGCTPTVEVAVPKEPITINLNIKLERRVAIGHGLCLDTLRCIDHQQGAFAGRQGA